MTLLLNTRSFSSKWNSYLSAPRVDRSAPARKARGQPRRFRRHGGHSSRGQPAHSSRSPFKRASYKSAVQNVDYVRIESSCASRRSRAAQGEDNRPIERTENESVSSANSSALRSLQSYLIARSTCSDDVERYPWEIKSVRRRENN